MNRMFLLAAYVCFLALPCRADAPPNTDPVQWELKGLAKDIAGTLKEHKTYKMGEFLDRGKQKTVFAPEITRTLMQELSALGYTLNPDDVMEVNGDYEPMSVVVQDNQPDFKCNCIHIDVKIVDKSRGKTRNTIPFEARNIFGEAAFNRAVAVPNRIPPNTSAKEANRIQWDSFLKPTFHLKGSTIKCASDSLFGVEMLVVDKNDAPDPDAGAAVQNAKSGLPFVAVAKSQYYRLRIFNNADHEVAARVSIDGIDMFAFSNATFRKEDGSPRFKYRVIAPRSSTVVSGWFRDSENFDYFVLTDYAKSAAAELKRSERDVGQVAVEFHACWETDAQRPADEPTGTRALLATGREQGGKEKTIGVQRTIGVTREVIGLRYGSKMP